MVCEAIATVATAWKIIFNRIKNYDFLSCYFGMISL